MLAGVLTIWGAWHARNLGWLGRPDAPLFHDRWGAGDHSLVARWHPRPPVWDRTGDTAYFDLRRNLVVVVHGCDGEFWHLGSATATTATFECPLAPGVQREIDCRMNEFQLVMGDGSARTAELPEGAAREVYELLDKPGGGSMLTRITRDRTTPETVRSCIVAAAPDEDD